MKAKYDWYGTYARRLSAAAFLAAVSLSSHAQGQATAADFKGFMQRAVGNTTSAGISLPGGGALVTSGAMSSAGGTSGWSFAPNFGAGRTSNGNLLVGQTGNLPYGSAGKSVPVNVTTPITRSAMAGAAARMFGGASPLGMAAMFGLPFFMEWMGNSDLARNPDTTTDPTKPFLSKTPHYSWRGNSPLCQGFSSAVEAAMCSVWRENGLNQGDFESCQEIGGVNANGAQGVVCKYTPNGTNVPTAAIRTHLGDTWDPANWVEARPKFEGGVLPSQVLQELIDFDNANKGKNGITPFKVDVDRSTVTGPGTAAPEPSEKTETTTKPCPTSGNPSATCTVVTKTTTITTPEIVYENEKMIVKPKTTTTTTTKTTDPDGGVTETTDKETTETKPEPETEGDLCKLHPDIVACQKLDTPEGEIPKGEKAVTFETESLGLGGGACPPNPQWNDFLGAHTINLAPYCNIISTVVKPLVLAFAALAALMIAMQGIKE